MCYAGAKPATAHLDGSILLPGWLYTFVRLERKIMMTDRYQPPTLDTLRENVTLKKMLFFSVLGVCEKRRPDEQKGPEDEHAREKDGRPDEDNRVEVAESSHTASPDSGEPPPGGRSMEPEPGRSVTLSPKSSASGRRALFARRRLDASTSASSEGSRSPRPRPLMPRGDPSPPRSPSPGARRSPAPLSSPSSPSCHVSSSTLRPVVPVRGLSPVTVQPHGSESRGPAGSFADLFAPSKARLHPGGRSANARPVRHNMLCGIFIVFRHVFQPGPLFRSRMRRGALFFLWSAYN